MSGALSPWRVTRVLPLIAGESLDGYVARVAAAHHMPRMAQITEVTGDIQSHRPHASFCDDTGLEILADCLGISPGSARLHSPLSSPDTQLLNLFGTLVPRNALQFSYRRFSPQALSMSAHHRGLWQLRHLPICTETWEYLEERCPNTSCRRRQVWRRAAGIDLCDYCAEPLTRAEATLVPESLRESLTMLIGLIHHDTDRRRIARRHLPPDLSDLGGGHLLELAGVLAPVIDRRVASSLNGRSLCLDTARNLIVPALAGTWPFLAGWPGAIEQHVAEKLNMGGIEKGGSTRKAFYQVLCDRNDPKLSPAVQKVLSRLFERCRAARLRGVTIAEMTKLTGADRPTLFEMRKAGKLPSFLALDGIRLQVLVAHETVAPLLAQNKPRVRLAHAGEMLGLPTYAIREMVHLGLVTAAPVPPGRGDYLQLAVYRDSLQAFQAKLSRRLAPAASGDPVSLAEAMRNIGGRPKPWAMVLKAIVDGDLQATANDGEDPLIQRIAFEPDQLPSLRCFQHNSSMDWSDCIVTKSDLAEMMNIKASRFSRHSEFLLGPGSALREVTMDTAQRLARTYICTREMSGKLRLYRRAVGNFAKKHGVKPQETGLFRRAEVEKLIPRLLGN
ncbi:TniQ family protein [Sphingomonas sp. GC_Shp_3]|uniref:TniQ family protein n=1 Tax=Sphingomonas sp. GC_Shp_3 TaxID=2937383 RepID=UPI00226997A0|nr:TniQ family protein [Sphingomonas sp. GC_Shp_3]